MTTVAYAHGLRVEAPLAFNGDQFDRNNIFLGKGAGSSITEGTDNNILGTYVWSSADESDVVVLSSLKPGSEGRIRWDPPRTAASSAC